VIAASAAASSGRSLYPTLDVSTRIQSFLAAPQATRPIRLLPPDLQRSSGPRRTRRLVNEIRRETGHADNAYLSAIRGWFTHGRVRYINWESNHRPRPLALVGDFNDIFFEAKSAVSLSSPRLHPTPSSRLTSCHSVAAGYRLTEHTFSRRERFKCSSCPLFMPINRT
jgi:hypothetical protein